MGKPSVYCPGKDEMEQPILSDVPQPLEDPRIDNSRLERRQNYVTVDRVPDRAFPRWSDVDG